MTDQLRERGTLGDILAVVFLFATLLTQIADLGFNLPGWFGAVAGGAAALLAMRYKLETVLQRDIDGDGRIGKPRANRSRPAPRPGVRDVTIVLCATALLMACGSPQSIEVHDPVGVVDCVILGDGHDSDAPPVLRCEGMGEATVLIVGDEGDDLISVPSSIRIGIDTETGEAWICPAIGEGPFAVAHCWRFPVRLRSTTEQVEIEVGEPGA